MGLLVGGGDGEDEEGEGDIVGRDEGLAVGRTVVIGGSKVGGGLVVGKLPCIIL